MFDIVIDSHNFIYVTILFKCIINRFSVKYCQNLIIFFEEYTYEFEIDILLFLEFLIERW